MTFQTYTCPNCHGVGGCHNYPCQGPFPPAPPVYFYNPTGGTAPFTPLTETDVRRIVREELAAIRAEAMVPQKESKS